MSDHYDTMILKERSKTVKRKGFRMMTKVTERLVGYEVRTISDEGILIMKNIHDNRDGAYEEAESMWNNGWHTQVIEVWESDLDGSVYRVLESEFEV